MVTDEHVAHAMQELSRYMNKANAQHIAFRRATEFDTRGQDIRNYVLIEEYSSPTAWKSPEIRFHWRLKGT